MIDERALDRVRGFELIERLPEPVQDELFRRSATVTTFEPGQAIYMQGQVDNFISYLLEGTVERIFDGQVEARLDAGDPVSRRPLDGLASKDHTLRASTPATVLQMTRRELERALRDAYTDTLLQVTEIQSDTADDWYTELLSSPLFGRLSAASIHCIFDRMEAVEVAAGEEVVRQGEPGDFYYVVQSGTCEVVRRPANGKAEVRLVTLEPGKGFGEDALITGAPRNATVRMLTDGEVRRLPRADFHELVLDALVQGVSINQGRWLVEQGGQWIDMRERAAFAHGTIEGAANIPPHLLRTQAGKLDPSRICVLFHDVPGTSMLGAFLLCERGFDTAYLNEPVGPHATWKPHPPAGAAVGVEHAVAHTAGDQATEPLDTLDAAKTDEPTVASDREDPPGSNTMGEPKRTNGDGRGDGPAGAASAPAARPTREDLGGTMIGDQLADLLDEIYDHREGLTEEPAAGDALAAGPPVAAPVMTASLAEPVAPPAAPLPDGNLDPVPGSGPAPDAEPSHSLDDTAREVVASAMRSFGQLEEALSRDLGSHRDELRNLLEAQLDQLERAAQARLEARARSLEAHYEQLYAEKERKLHEAYEKLAALADRISMQKVEINKARKGLESMLQTASRVHREVFRAGSSLVEKLDHLGEIGSDVEPH